MIILIILIFSLFGIGFLINKNIIKHKTVNEVPNHYLSFGSISRSTDDNGKTFSVEVTPKVPLFEISIHVYIYKFDKLIYDANYINDVDVRTTGTYVEIPFAKDELINSQYTYLFYGTGKTHEPLPKIDYASVSFLNYDGSLYEKMDVEKNMVKYGLHQYLLEMDMNLLVGFTMKVIPNHLKFGNNILEKKAKI